MASKEEFALRCAALWDGDLVFIGHGQYRKATRKFVIVQLQCRYYYLYFCCIQLNKMAVRHRLLQVLLCGLASAAALGGPQRDPPEWLRNLVIYEINPMGFANLYEPPKPPVIALKDAQGREIAGSQLIQQIHGSEDSPWVKITKSMGYLKQLGVTGIWMAGYCLANNHFYDIWSVYATVDPGQLDPRLGRLGR